MTLAGFPIAQTTPLTSETSYTGLTMGTKELETACGGAVRSRFVFWDEKRLREVWDLGARARA
jgi:hypothetical protein